jgi:hypothetical protein
MITAYLISNGKVTQFNIRVPESQVAASEVATAVPVKQIKRTVKLPRRDYRGRFMAATPKPAAIEKNPMAYFWYPASKGGFNRFRTVRVVSSDAKYLTGLELSPETERWQFKKYFQSQIKDLRMTFNEGAMS